MPLPSERPASGRRFGPSTSRAMTRTTSISGNPMGMSTPARRIPDRITAARSAVAPGLQPLEQVGPEALAPPALAALAIELLQAGRALAEQVLIGDVGGQPAADVVATPGP